MVIPFERKNFPPDIEPEVGMTLNMHSEDGNTLPVVIAEVNTDTILLDANHPLAGEDLIFDIELVDVKGKSPLIIMP